MSIENLLKEVNSILKKYEEFEKLTGEKFNIFKILNVDKSELKHSAFIAELLNPNGTHGLGAEFLIQFVQIFKIPNFSEVDCLKSLVTYEFDLGKINELKSTGGRVDIIIKSGNNGIVIENKIYAGDCENQLVRYHNAYPKASLIYLTLSGNSPSPKSFGELKEGIHFVCNSYYNDILKWLIACKEKSVSHPMLRECLSQYINLIKLLTHQSSNKMQDIEVQKLIIETKGTFESAKNISLQLQETKAKINMLCNKDMISNWILKYGKEEVELFHFNNFTFYTRLSFEDKYFHIDLFPRNKDVQGSLGYAEYPELIKFNLIAKKFKDRIRDNFSSNANYTVWVKSEFDIVSLPFEKYRLLFENRSEWLTNIMCEADLFIKHMVDSLKLMNDPNIIIDPKFL